MTLRCAQCAYPGKTASVRPALHTFDAGTPIKPSPVDAFSASCDPATDWRNEWFGDYSCDQARRFMDRADRCVRRMALRQPPNGRVRAPPVTSLSEISVQRALRRVPKRCCGPSGGINSPPAISVPTARELKLRVPGNKRAPETVVPCVGRPAIPQAPHRDAGGHGIPGARIK